MCDMTSFAYVNMSEENRDVSSLLHSVTQLCILMYTTVMLSLFALLLAHYSTTQLYYESTLITHSSPLFLTLLLTTLRNAML
jgi:glutaminase